MQGQCDQVPTKFVESRGKIQFRFNVREIQVETDLGTRTAYAYEYVEAEKPTNESILEAMTGVENASVILNASGPIIVTTEPEIK